jgi:hypothetical protein
LHGPRLNWGKDESLTRLQAKFGALKPADLGAYIEWLYELSQNGLGHQGLEKAA